MSKIIETSTAYISLLKGNIVKMQFKPEIVASIENIKQNHEVAQKITKGKKHFVLLDVRGFATGSDKARSFCASKNPIHYRIAVAALVNSLAERLRCMAYIKINKPIVPTCVFSNESEAIDWLKEFSKKEANVFGKEGKSSQSK
jgi:hypothetical protein